MPKTLKDKKGYADRAGEAYKKFQKRMEKNFALTRFEKEDRTMGFLDAHVGVFDEYYSDLKEREAALARQRQNPRAPKLVSPIKKDERLSGEALEMAVDVAAFFDDSEAAGYLKQKDSQRLPGSISALLRDRYEREFEGYGTDAKWSYMSDARRGFAKSQRQTSMDFSGEEEEEPVWSDEIEQDNGQLLSKPLSSAQIKGIRDITAFLFRNTIYKGVGNYGPFVEGIATRYPREKLLIYYLVEKDKLHDGITYPDLYRLQTDENFYIPNLDEFRPQMLHGIMGGALFRVTGKNLHWHKLSNAIQMTKGLMGLVLLFLRIASMPSVPSAVPSLASDPSAIPSSPAASSTGPSLPAVSDSAAAAEEEPVTDTPKAAVTEIKKETVSEGSPAPAEPTIPVPAAETKEETEPTKTETGAPASKEGPDEAAAVKDILDGLKNAGANAKSSSWRKNKDIEKDLVFCLMRPNVPLRARIKTVRVGELLLDAVRKRMLPDVPPPASEKADAEKEQEYIIPKAIADYMAYRLARNTGPVSSESRDIVMQFLAKHPEPGREEATEGAPASVAAAAAAASAEEDSSAEESDNKAILDKLKAAGADVKGKGWDEIKDVERELAVWLMNPRFFSVEKGEEGKPVGEFLLDAVREKLLPNYKEPEITGTRSTTEQKFTIPKDILDYMAIRMQGNVIPISPANEAAAINMLKPGHEEVKPEVEIITEEEGLRLDKADPELFAALGRITGVGQALVSNPNPSQDMVDAFREEVEALARLIESREKTVWQNTTGYSKFWKEVFNCVKSPASVVSSFLKGPARIASMFEGTSKAGIARTNTAGTVFSGIGTSVGILTTILGFVGMIESLRQMGQSGLGAKDRAFKIFVGLQSIAASGNSSFGTVKGFASLAGAAWSSGGAAIIAGSFLGMGIAAMSSFTGEYHMIHGAKNEYLLDKFIDQLIDPAEIDRAKNDPNLSEEQLEQLEAKRRLIFNVASAARNNETLERHQGTYQTASAAFQMLASFSSLLGPLTAILTGIFSLTAFAIGMKGIVSSYYEKKATKQQVIDRYIGMPQMYGGFIEDQGGQQNLKNIIKEFGAEDDIKEMLRVNAEAELGFPDDDTMNDFIMRQYARVLYSGAFFDDMGNKIRDNDQAKITERKMFAGLIEAMRFEVHYPPADEDDAEPSPTAEEIYKKLTK